MTFTLESKLTYGADGFALSPDGTYCALLRDEEVLIYSIPELKVAHTLKVEYPYQAVFLSDNSLIILSEMDLKKPFHWDGKRLKKLAKWPIGTYDFPWVYRVDDHNLYFETNRDDGGHLWRFDCANWRPLRLTKIDGQIELYHCDESSLYVMHRDYQKSDRMIYDLITLNAQGEEIHRVSTEKPLEIRNTTRGIRTSSGNIIFSTLCAPEWILPDPPQYFSFEFTPDGRAYIPGSQSASIPEPDIIPMLYLLDSEGKILAARTDIDDIGKLFSVGNFVALVCDEKKTVSFLDPDTLECCCHIPADFFGVKNAPTFVAYLPNNKVMLGSEEAIYLLALNP